jgi:hypothetical protein
MEDCGHLTFSWGQQCDVIDLLSKVIEAATSLPPFHGDLPLELRQTMPMSMNGHCVKDVAAYMRTLADHVEDHPEVVQNGMNAISHDFMISRLPPHPSQLPRGGLGEPPETEEDHIQVIGDFFCILRDTPSTNMVLKPSNGTVDVNFEGESDLRIMSSVGNLRETHMMNGSFMGGDHCEGDGCCDNDDHCHHDHREQKNETEVFQHDVEDMKESDCEDEETGSEEDDTSDEGQGSLISLPSKFKHAIGQIFKDRRPVCIRDLNCDDKMTLANLLCQLGICIATKKRRKAE